MSLHDKLKTYPKEYDLSDIHIRSNQPFAIRENGEIKVFENDVISRQDIESFWKQSLDKAQYDYLITNGDLVLAQILMLLQNYLYLYQLLFVKLYFS